MLEGFDAFHKVMYEYHRKGLDFMANDIKTGKENIANAILELNKIKNLRINNFPLLLFFNAKSDEITEIFSAGKPIDNVQKVKETLESLAPLYFEKWQKIK